MASGSIPFTFPPRQWKGYVLADGGTVWNLNIDSAINQCIDAGYDASDIIVDIAVCYYSNPAPQEVSRNAWTNYWNGKAIQDYYTGSLSLMAETRARNDVEYRYYFQEHNTGCAGSSLDFTNSTTWCKQEAGRRDAKAMLEFGQDKIHKSLEEWYDSKPLQKKWPSIGDYVWSLIYDSSP